ncbi:RpiB/LacA/LacB family sugar-phosphate isomerase [Rheinheimera sp. UJ51]|uniref:RpiB/LacA/LacB family sugar-phosphate isomerase n=1 Tax=unclassified Rheinheimera TaxID=115860 RepID=UPI001E657834|nr:MULTISPECIES: RpiB/LacA/LacB family sugar-phosphate isomerase [unclassified Rheinheimera]MCC5453381.1 RpiB/LacA/LacB family sugar-phosphate isomerase [Rheinheimera sp. UJ51]MCF4010959.1 RpiB/LacA/LacB family sugar-phosphate isomerase [Rheinheimera sp. UJ63]
MNLHALGVIMKIALMMENSQAAKNAMVLAELEGVVKPLGHEVYNVGMNNENDHHLTYVHLGIQASLLLNANAVDFVVAGCGTGQGAMMSLNAHPGVLCGYCLEPTDAFLFNQVNNGNAIALAFAKGFGWGAELNLRYMFEKAFTSGDRGQGYPTERAEPQQKNAVILSEVKAAIAKDTLLESFKNLEQELVRQAVGSERFQSAFFANCESDELAEYVKGLI